MNKKLIGVGVGIVIVIIVLIGMQSYKTVPEDITNPPNAQFSNTTLQKSVNTGKHITVELNESMQFAIK